MESRSSVKPLVTRFAPSPTGHLHLGHAHAAVFAWRLARAGTGRFLVRIEDIDRQRCRDTFATDLLEDLTWLGLDWDGPVLWQSRNMAAYAAALETLERQGVLYPCFCSRKDLAEATRAPHWGEDEGPPYPGFCREMPLAQRQEWVAKGRAHALRLDVRRALALTGPLYWTDRAVGCQTAQPLILGDVILARRDIPTSYHLSVTVDDAQQGVSLVTRGEDLFPATHIHRLLQALLALPTPDYHHHSVLMAPDGRRLSKRNGALTLRALCAAGRTAAEVWALAGWDANYQC